MVAVVEGFRGTAAPDWTMMAASTSAILVLLSGGLYFFCRMEGTFADVI